MRGGNASGGAGNDVIAFRAGSVGDDFWTIDGGHGADTIVGSQVTDTIAGGGGADHIDVTGDARTDTVTCGDGVDHVYADPEDDVAAGLREASTRPRCRRSRPVTAALDRATHLAEELQPLFDDPRA